MENCELKYSYKTLPITQEYRKHTHGLEFNRKAPFKQTVYEYSYISIIWLIIWVNFDRFRWPLIIWVSYHLTEFFFFKFKTYHYLSFSKTFEFQLTGHWHCKHKAVFGSGSTLKFTSFIKILSFDWVGFYWKIPLSFEWVIIWVSYFFRAFGAVLSYDWVIIWPNYDCIYSIQFS